MPYGMSYRPAAPRAAGYSSYSAPAPASRSSGATYATSSQESHSAPRRNNVTYATQSRVAGLGQVEVPPIAPISDPWYQQKARELQRVAASAVMSGLGQDELLTPPPPKSPNTGMMLGWLAVTAIAAGLFWAVTSGPMGKPVRANRRRRSSRRRRRVSRNMKRRSSRGDRAESQLARTEAREEKAHLRRTIGAAGLIGEWNRLQDEAMALIIEKVRLLKAGKPKTVVQKKIDAIQAKIRKIEQSTGYYDHDEADRRRAAYRERKPPVRAVRGPDGKVRLVRKNSRRRSSRRVSRNVRKSASSAYAQAQTALSTIRNLGVNGAPSAAKLSKSVQDKLARRGMGLYRVGGSGRSPKITAFASSTSLRGAMTNTRIATTASGEPHWLVKVYKSGRPKVVVVRYIGKDGKTRFRAEEYARAMFKVAQEYARGLRSRRVG